MTLYYPVKLRLHPSWSLCRFLIHVLLSHLSCIRQMATQHCFPLFTCCVWCHPLTGSGKASSDSIYTPHRTRLLKMPLFPMITFWQHTVMSWPHPVLWFPWVIQFYIWCDIWVQVCWSFCSLFFLFCWKTWILYGNKSCSSQKGTTIDTPLQQDKNKKSQERRSSISLVCVARKSEYVMENDDVWSLWVFCMAMFT